jgi:Spy/CpxP family protein refolding chaperone
MSTVTLPRPAERAAIFSLLLVFLCGLVAGVLIMSLARNVGVHGAHGLRPVSASLSPMSVTEMKEGLNLTEDQTRQMTSVLDDFSRYYDDLLADGNSRILQILNPDQKKRFDQMLQQHRK